MFRGGDMQDNIPKKPEALLDCEAGRRMGCATFCCRLVVRLQPGERDPGAPDNALKNCVDKNPRDGLCVHIDRGTGRCLVWDERPTVCRTYECNSDPLLQVVLREGYHSMVRLAFASEPPPGAAKLQVPLVGARSVKADHSA